MGLSPTKVKGSFTHVPEGRILPWRWEVRSRLSCSQLFWVYAGKTPLTLIMLVLIYRGDSTHLRCCCAYPSHKTCASQEIAHGAIYTAMHICSWEALDQTDPALTHLMLFNANMTVTGAGKRGALPFSDPASATIRHHNTKLHQQWFSSVLMETHMSTQGEESSAPTCSWASVCKWAVDAVGWHPLSLGNLAMWGWSEHDPTALICVPVQRAITGLLHTE